MKDVELESGGGGGDVSTKVKDLGVQISITAFNVESIN